MELLFRRRQEEVVFGSGYKSDQMGVLRILQRAGSKVNKIPGKQALAAGLECIDETPAAEFRTELPNREKHYGWLVVQQNSSQG